jgi:3-methylcrotonyl-CoA carboxylase alpha subunit
MAQALAQYQIVGLSTNVAFLKRLIEGQAFASADLDTGLIERNHDSLFPLAQPAPTSALALAAAALLSAESSPVSDPWHQTRGWRLNQCYARKLAFSDEHTAYDTHVTYRPEDWLFSASSATPQTLTLRAHDGDNYHIQLGDQSAHGTVLRDGDTFHIFSNGAHYQLTWNDPMAHAGETESEGGRLTAPMPGKVVAVLAAKGQEVKKGAALVIMEAMKMEHTIAAPHDGIVEDILYSVGDQVSDGAPLLAFKAA